VTAAEAGRAWLLGMGPVEEYAGLLRVPAGAAFDLVRVPYAWARRALGELLDSGTVPVGPVLLVARREVLEWLVPAGTVTDWAVSGTCCVGVGAFMRCPFPGEVRASRLWLRPPDGSGRLTPGWALREALKATAE